MNARVFCVKEKRPGFLLIGCEPRADELVKSFLNELDPHWQMEVIQIVPLGEELVLAIKGQVRGDQRGLAVRVPRSADPSYEALVAFASLFGFEPPKREKLWFVLPKEEWQRYEGRELTWEEAKALALQYRVEGRPTYQSLAHTEIARRLSECGWTESKLILELLEAGVLERAVPGLEFLTPEQAERVLDFLETRARSGEALPF